MAPVANAGPAQSVTGGDLVTLNGSDSFDYEDDEISYLWTSPEGIILSNNTIVNPTFTAPETDLPFIDLEFSLMVNDGNSNSLPAYVTITVLNDNLMPIADAGESNTVLATTNYILDGTDHMTQKVKILHICGQHQKVLYCQIMPVQHHISQHQRLMKQLI